MIRPHGGKLIQRVLPDEAKGEILERAHSLPHLELDEESAGDLENIAAGVYSPLEGFLGREDFHRVIDRMRLSNGTPWTIPIVLDATKEEAGRLKIGSDVILTTRAGGAVAVIHLAEKFEYDREETARKVFQTTDASHPGAVRVLAGKDVLLGGKIDLLRETPSLFARFKLSPEETRVLFKVKGWRTIAGFSAREAPQSGVEAALKAALAFVDGIFLNPAVVAGRSAAGGDGAESVVIVGRDSLCADGSRQSADGDYRSKGAAVSGPENAVGAVQSERSLCSTENEALVSAWDKLLKEAFPPERAVMAVLRMEPRHAGPREAVLNAIIQKNFGCTHILIDLDRAGVDDYYHPRAAQDIFEEFPDLGIVPLFFRGSASAAGAPGFAREAASSAKARCLTPRV